MTFSSTVSTRLNLLRHSTMSATNSLANPPWKKTIQDILQKNLDDGHTDSLFFTLATVKPGPHPRPAARTVGFRGFIGEPKDDKSSGKLPGGNPPAQSSLILLSTDTLMAKVGEIEQTGGVYEGCWWHAGTNQQIRFSGTAHLYRRNAKIEFPETRLKQYISVQGNGEWSWEAERERMWRAHKPGLRGSFRNPPPGSPLDSEEKRRKLKAVELDGDDNGAEAREAKERFALVVLEVTELDILDLDPPPVYSTCILQTVLMYAGKTVSMDFIERFIQHVGGHMACDRALSMKDQQPLAHNPMSSQVCLNSIPLYSVTYFGPTQPFQFTDHVSPCVGLLCKLTRKTEIWSRFPSRFGEDEVEITGHRHQPSA